MNRKKLIKLTTVTDLRYKTASVVRDMNKEQVPYAITKDSKYVGVLMPPELYERAMSTLEGAEDQTDAIDLENEIATSVNEKGTDFEKYIESKLGKNHVQNYHKKKTAKVS